MCRTGLEEALSAARRLQRQARTLGEAFTDDGVEPVVDPILMLLQQLHHRVVRAAEDQHSKC